MPEFVALGGEVGLVVSVLTGMQRHPFRDCNTKRFEGYYLAGVVGEEAQRANAEVRKHGSTHRVAARIGRKSQFFVGLHGVRTAVLQMIGLDLVAKADIATFLPQIQNHAAACGCDAPHRFFQLRSAIAAQAEQGIARQAFGMDATQCGLIGGRITKYKRKVFLAGSGVGKYIQVELAPLGWKFGRGGKSHCHCKVPGMKKKGVNSSRIRQPFNPMLPSMQAFLNIPCRMQHNADSCLQQVLV